MVRIHWGVLEKKAPRNFRQYSVVRLCIKLCIVRLRGVIPWEPFVIFGRDRAKLCLPRPHRSLDLPERLSAIFFDSFQVVWLTFIVWRRSECLALLRATIGAAPALQARILLTKPRLNRAAKLETKPCSSIKDNLTVNSAPKRLAVSTAEVPLDVLGAFSSLLRQSSHDHPRVDDTFGRES